MTRERRPHVVDEVVDDVVVADFNTALFGKVARFFVGAHVETDDDRLRGLRERHIGFGDAPDAAVNDARLNFVVAEFFDRRGDRLHRALDIALDDDRQFLAARRLQVAHHVGERRTRGWPARGELLALLALAVFGNFAGARFCLDDGDAVASLGSAREAERLDRHRGSGQFDRNPLVVDERPDPAPMRAGDDQRADRATCRAAPEWSRPVRGLDRAAPR